MIKDSLSSVPLAVIFCSMSKESRSVALDAQDAEMSSKQSKIRSVLSLGTLVGGARNRMVSHGELGELSGRSILMALLICSICQGFDI
jgi:hypothetical protein